MTAIRPKPCSLSFKVLPAPTQVLVVIVRGVRCAAQPEHCAMGDLTLPSISPTRLPQR
jgi:hypothetical protein